MALSMSSELGLNFNEALHLKVLGGCPADQDPCFGIPEELFSCERI